jgi:uncharacterized radical SAM protein YgiQ
MQGKEISICKSCKRYSCIYPSICKNLDFDHGQLIDIYNKASEFPGIKKITIGSGVRYDMLLTPDKAVDKTNHLSQYASVLIRNHVSGRLKVAPEHTSDEVLKIMRKSSFSSFRKFNAFFNKICYENKLNQQIIPYFISSHPGCRLEHMAELAATTKELGFQLEQVQDFTPTPMTLATEIYYSGLDPYTLKPIYIARSGEEKKDQQRFFFWYKKENSNWIRDILIKLKREDLISKFIKDNRYISKKIEPVNFNNTNKKHSRNKKR